LTPRLGLALAVVVTVLVACSGGGKPASAAGRRPPTTLELPGAGPIPTSQLTAAASQMCAIVAQSHSDPGGVLDPFYGGPHNDLHLLAAVAHASHPAEAQNLLDVMLTYESAIADKPPPPETGQDAAALLQAVDATLSALGVPPPGC
jgi:hypothetical protein